MNVAIRYQSRGGHVKEIAQIISSGIDVEPISIDDPRARITKHVDVLFIGGALYSFRLDPAMEKYLKGSHCHRVWEFGAHSSSGLSYSGTS